MSEAEWKARAVALARADLLRMTAAAAVRSARSARARRGWSTRRRNLLDHVKRALRAIDEMSFFDIHSGERLVMVDDRGRVMAPPAPVTPAGEGG